MKFEEPNLNSTRWRKLGKGFYQGTSSDGKKLAIIWRTIISHGPVAEKWFWAEGDESARNDHQHRMASSEEPVKTAEEVLAAAEEFLGYS